MDYQFKFQLYQCPFQPPLQTSHGCWRVREGIIVQLTAAAGRVGWGEIAPLPWFGSETLEQALCFCQQLPPQIAATTIFSIPSELPACQFGFESAWESVTDRHNPLDKSADALTYCGLLPTGQTALEAWPSLWEQGYHTFKWKIGVTEPTQELEQFKALVQALPPTAKLRLDANGGLNWETTAQWLTVCDQVITPQVEFLEQPLAVAHFEAMVQLNQIYQTPLALDESVATLPQLSDGYQRGWRGIFVIKPAIAGSPQRLRQFCQQHSIDVVFSSAFETQIGRQAGLQLALELGNTQRAVGYGVDHWLGDHGTMKDNLKLLP
jgi:O-succinylbenzoate synthase